MTSFKFLFLNLVVFFFLSGFYVNDLRSQGCSDAGFCSIHSLKPADESDSKFKNNFSIGISYGRGDNKINVVNPFIEYTREVSSLFSISGKVVFTSVSGDIANLSGLSDGFINAVYKMNQAAAFTLGVKIPFTNGNTMSDNSPLPMAYQVSLGTLDIIAGVNHNHKNFGFSAALQYPLTQNENKYFSTSNADEMLFSSTNKYKRGGDVLARLSYRFTPADGKISITPGVLPIYHLSNDKYTDASGTEKEIDGSKGLTLNANLFVVYSIDSKNSLELNFGAPVKSRDSRPDGLTRKFVAVLGYKVNF
jgi:hypothetical protein